jgi:hypothetical protein
MSTTITLTLTPAEATLVLAVMSFAKNAARGRRAHLVMDAEQHDAAQRVIVSLTASLTPSLLPTTNG